MKFMKKVLVLTLAFMLAIPNMVGIVLSQDITDYTQSYPKNDTEYEQITIGDGIQVPAKLKLRYDGGSTIGLLTDDSTDSSETCNETSSISIYRGEDAKEDLAEHICRIVDKYQVPHQVIELELTESAFFDDKEILLQTVKKLREAGFIVSMDDFGAGYSSLNSLNFFL